MFLRQSRLEDRVFVNNCVLDGRNLRACREWQRATIGFKRYCLNDLKTKTKNKKPLSSLLSELWKLIFFLFFLLPPKISHHVPIFSVAYCIKIFTIFKKNLLTETTCIYYNKTLRHKVKMMRHVSCPAIKW